MSANQTALAEHLSHDTSRPAFSVLLERARALTPRFAALARETESNGRVPRSSMELLRDADLLKLVKPALFGGYEYGPAELAQIGFELGRGCGSTGWCGTLAIFYHLILSYFPYETQQEVYATSDDLVAVSYTPSRTCEAAPGGYRITGVWPYASNSDNAGWLMLAGLIAEGEGPPSLRWFLVPAKAAAIDPDSWRTSGLQGTGSKTVHIKEPVFVPEHRMLRFSDVVAGLVPGRDIAGNVMSRFAFPTVGPTALVSPILGMAQGAIDAFLDNVRSRVRAAKPGTVIPVASSPLIQMRLGSSTATIEAAKTLLVASLEAMDSRVRAGGQLDVAERITVRRNQGFAARQAVTVVNDLFGKDGASGSSSAAPLQRLWRDVNAAALHISLDWEAIASMYGQNRLGLEPVGTY